MVQGVALDYMHGVLEGVTKLLLGLWVEAPQDCLYAVPAKEIDKRMRGILVPDVINPLPRGVSERKHWKGIPFHAVLFVYILQFVFLSVN